MAQLVDGFLDRPLPKEGLLSGLTPVDGCNTMKMRAVDCLPCHEGEAKHHRQCWRPPTVA
jgi:hypothetical protein